MKIFLQHRKLYNFLATRKFLSYAAKKIFRLKGGIFLSVLFILIVSSVSADEQKPFIASAHTSPLEAEMTAPGMKPFPDTPRQDEGSLEGFIYDDHGRRDPLWRLVGSNGTIFNYETEFLITDLVLEGVMAGAGEGNLAIINRRILKAGDVIGQFIIEKIDKNSVILKKGKQKFELKLEKGE